METALQNQGIRVFQSDRFRSGASIPGKFLRVALASVNSMQELEVGLDILKSNITVTLEKSR